MSDLWDWGKDRDICYDIDKVKRRLNELRGQNTREDFQQWLNNCLWWAALDGQFEVSEHLLGEGGDPKWRYGVNTAIHVAALRNHSRFLRLFMDAYGGWSPRPDVTDIYGVTPLWDAGYNGHRDCVEILLSRGADPLYERTQSDRNYQFLCGVSFDDNPLSAATKRNHGEIVEMMQRAIEVRKHPFVQHLSDERDKLKTRLVHRDTQFREQEQRISGLEYRLDVCQKKIASLEEQLKRALEGNDHSRLREEISHLSGERSALLSEIQYYRSLFSDAIRSQTVSGSVVSRAGLPYHRHASPLHVLPPLLNPQRVLSVVQQQSSCRWYPLGRAMGLTSDQLHIFGKGLAYDCDKLQAVFDEKAKEVGEVTAADMLLQACRSIQNPTIGAVEGELQKHCGSSSVGH